MAKAKKKPAKKAAKKTSAAPKKRAAKVQTKDHLQRAHKAVLRILDTVTADDAEGIARLRRLVDHAHENASADARAQRRAKP